MSAPDPAAEPAAFVGEIKVPLAISCLYVRHARRGFITYHYTPRWPYYHVASGMNRLEPPVLDYMLGLILPARQARFMGVGKGPVRVELPLLLVSMQGQPAMRAAVEWAIDSDVRRRDGETRRLHGVGGHMPDNWL
jgi:hypothetical protein